MLAEAVPETPPEIYMSAFGPEAARLAGEVADGPISTVPDLGATRKVFDDAGGVGKPAPGGVKVCWAVDEERAVKKVVACGPEPERHIAAVREYGGYDEVYVSQIGGRAEEFFLFYRDYVLPELRS